MHLIMSPATDEVDTRVDIIFHTCAAYNPRVNVPAETDPWTMNGTAGASNPVKCCLNALRVTFALTEQGSMKAIPRDTV